MTIDRRNKSWSPSMRANEILNTAQEHMAERAKTYDAPGGERSMTGTVQAFNVLTGHTLTEEQGWLFMALLKMCRSQQGKMRLDSYEDGAAYFALAGEAACKHRGGKGCRSINDERYGAHD